MEGCVQWMIVQPSVTGKKGVRKRGWDRSDNDIIWGSDIAGTDIIGVPQVCAGRGGGEGGVRERRQSQVLLSVGRNEMWGEDETESWVGNCGYRFSAGRLTSWTYGVLGTGFHFEYLCVGKVWLCLAGAAGCRAVDHATPGD